MPSWCSPSLSSSSTQTCTTQLCAPAYESDACYRCLSQQQKALRPPQGCHLLVGCSQA